MIKIMAHCQHGIHESNMILKDTHGLKFNTIHEFSLHTIPLLI